MIVWTQTAQKRAHEITKNIANYAGERAALRFVNEVQHVLALAEQNPNMGKKGIMQQTRELYPLHGKYRVVYQFKDNTLYVLTIRSCKQRYTKASMKKELKP